MQAFEQLEYENFYHIYNHGVGGRDIFRKPDNYEYFLGLYDKHIFADCRDVRMVPHAKSFSFVGEDKKCCNYL